VIGKTRQTLLSFKTQVLW